MSIPKIGNPPGPAVDKSSGPHFEIRESKAGVIKGPYFVLIDSTGKQVFESNVYLGGAEEEREGFCQDGAQRELKKWIEKGKIS